VAFPIDPRPLVGGLLSILSLGLAFHAARLGVRTYVHERPWGVATLGGLVLALSLPLAAFGGGGGAPKSYRRWIVSDSLGSGMLELSHIGSRVQATVFRPFGGEAARVGGGTAFGTRFGGHRKDDDSGLYYMNARWMDPNAGRFVSVDPLVASTARPQSHNGYSYVENNPISGIDPTGRTKIQIFTTTTKMSSTGEPVGQPQIQVVVMPGGGDAGAGGDAPSSAPGSPSPGGSGPATGPSATSATGGLGLGSAAPAGNQQTTTESQSGDGEPVSESAVQSEIDATNQLIDETVGAIIQNGLDIEYWQERVDVRSNEVDNPAGSAESRASSKTFLGLLRSLFSRLAKSPNYRAGGFSITGLEMQYAAAEKLANLRQERVGLTKSLQHLYSHRDDLNAARGSER